MFTRILVPLDGSAEALAVLPVAAQLTRARQGTLILIRVYDLPPSDVPLGVIEAQEEQAQAYLTRVALRPDLAGLQVETKTLGGAVSLNLLDAVQEYQADLLVMRSHGRSGFKRWVLGSVAEDIIRHTSVPVLILHQPHDGQPANLAAPVALVALDGSPQAETSLLPAADILAALTAPQEGTLHLVRVVSPPVAIRWAEDPAQRPSLLEREDQTLREAEDYLIQISARLQAQGLDGHHPAITWSLQVSEQIAPALISAFEQAGQEAHGAMFLALVTREHSRREYWMGGSLAASMLQHCALPLLIVHAKQDQGGSPPTA